ncbi:MAG: ABC-type transport auxiliary lipoprotein family protein [Pseudomonadota bacterium]|nr:ABC-type transport auxiliary lipoprotein family protein [Pseudomonadota bacterium]
MCVMFTMICGCTALRPETIPQPNFYSLDHVQTDVRPLPPAPASAPTLIISPTHAAAGFDSQRIIYMRQPHKPEYYAYNEWVDTPARMLAPLIVNAIEHSRAFRAVIQMPSPAAGELRLDTEVVRLQHEFLSQPSRVRFTLRAYIVNSATRRVLTSHEFDALIVTTSEDPYGGVVAANQAVSNVLEELATFCVETIASIRSTPGALSR